MRLVAQIQFKLEALRSKLSDGTSDALSIVAKLGDSAV